jgi:hypothetical protein
MALLSAAANGQNVALADFVRRTVLDSLATNGCKRINPPR